MNLTRSKIPEDTFSRDVALADLTDLMTKRLEQLHVGSKEPTLHSTRLNEEFLNRLPELHAQYVLLAFQDDVVPTWSKACEFTDALQILLKVTELVRGDICKRRIKAFEEHFQETSVPPFIFELISIIEHSPEIQSQIENETTKSDQIVTQIVQYNCNQSRSKKAALVQRHSKDRETYIVYMSGCCYLPKQENVNYMSPFQF